MGMLMSAVVIREKYITALSPFGDLQTAVDLALERYTIEQIAEKLAELRQREAIYREKYGLDFNAIAGRVSSDERFVTELEARGFKTWEADLADWEFCHEGSRDWTRRLQTLLLE